MASLNKVLLIGHVGKDPELKHCSNGSCLTSFPVATTETWKDKETKQKKEKTEWHNITMFGKLADIAVQYVAKGMKVYIEGKITTDKWTDKEGIVKYSTKIIASSMIMLSPKTAKNMTIKAVTSYADSTKQNAHGENTEDMFDDDIPF